MSARAASPPISGTASLPGLLLRQARERGAEVALRDKHRGLWREITWGSYAQRTAQVGLALAELGVRPGDRVAIHASNRPEWVIADLAIQGIGAVAVGVEDPEVEAALAHCEARVLFAEGDEQLDRALAAREGLPALERIVVMDSGSDRRLDDRAVVTFFELEHAVPVRGAVQDWASHVEDLDPASVATIVYTGSEPGHRKGAMLTHANLAWAAGTLRESLSARPDDEILSALPLGHIAERVISVATAVDSGLTVNFGEGGDSFARDVRDVQPTVVVRRAREWEAVMAGVEARMADASRAKRAAYKFGAAGGGPVGNALARRPVRAKLGLAQVRAALSVAGPVEPRTLESLRSLGVEVRELYGLAETTSVCTLAPPGHGRPGTAGRVPDGVEVRIFGDDEILVRSPGVFAGYFRDEEATRAAIEPTGWVHTGDRGMFDPDGFLTLT